MYVSAYYYVCPHISRDTLAHLQKHVNNVASQVLLYMCPHTIICVILLLHLCRSSQALLYMCPHTNMCPHIPHVKRDTRTHLQKYVYNVAAQVPLHVCLHTKYVSSYCYICVLILVER